MNKNNIDLIFIEYKNINIRSIRVATKSNENSEKYVAAKHVALVRHMTVPTKLADNL